MSGRLRISLKRRASGLSLQKILYNTVPSLKNPTFFKFKLLTGPDVLNLSPFSQVISGFTQEFWSHKYAFKIYNSFWPIEVTTVLNNFRFNRNLKHNLFSSFQSIFFHQTFSFPPHSSPFLEQTSTSDLKYFKKSLSHRLFAYGNYHAAKLVSSLSLQFHSLQHHLYRTIRRQTLLQNRLLELTINRKAKSHIWQTICNYPVSTRLLTNITHREQVPPFSKISKYRNVSLFSTSKGFSLICFFTRKRQVSLRNSWTTPLNLSTGLKVLLSTPLNSSYLPKPAIVKKTMKTHLGTKIIKRLMRKRLFRPKPTRTFLRTIRYTRRFWVKWRRSNLLTELNKKDKKAQALIYEKALFEEILSTPKGEEGPLLRSLKYTGFETMPSLDQNLGNKIFLIKRKLRNTIFKSRLPRGKIRRHEIRKLLQKYAFWAWQVEQFRLLSKSLNESEFERDYGAFVSEEAQKRYRYAKRYWRKRAAYFSRRSSVKQYFGRYFNRLKRTKKIRPRLWLSRNFRAQFLLAELSTPIATPRFSHIRFKTYQKRPRRKKKLKSRYNLLVKTLNFKKFNKKKLFLLSQFQKRTKSSTNCLRQVLKTFLRKKLLNKSFHLRLLLPAPLTITQQFPQLLNLKPIIGFNNDSKNLNFNIDFSSIPFFLIFRFWHSHIFVKYWFFKYYQFYISHLEADQDISLTQSVRLFVNVFQQQIKAYSFAAMFQRLPQANTWSYFTTKYTLNKKLLRSVSQMAFKADVTSWTQRCLIQFLENMSGRKIAINVGPFVDHILTVDDHARCFLWDNRSSGFKKLLGHRIFTSEAIMIVTASLRLKDPTLLANWIRGMLYRMSFWKYRVLFRYLKFLIQHLFRFNFPDFSFKGFKLRLKGKISVGGNSRSRILFYRVGDTSHSKMSNKIAYDLSYINTFTGVLGFKLWFFY